MEKLNKKEKHKHLFTNILKGSIFAIVMLAPMFSVLTRCLYVVCNPNAKDSYSDTSIYENKNITNYQDLALGTKYTLTAKPVVSGNTQVANRISYISLTIDELNITQAQHDNINFMMFNYASNVAYLRFSNSSAPTTWITSVALTTGYTFDVILDDSLNPSLQYIHQWFYTNQIILTTNNLDNAFEYSIEQLEESSMYNWAKNTAIYEGLHDMCSGMGTNDVIPLLLAYWALLTAIYIVFDIIIWCFTKITHFVSAD